MKLLALWQTLESFGRGVKSLVGAPQLCRGKSPGFTLNVVAPDGRLTDGLKVEAGARKVSFLQGIAHRSIYLSIDRSRRKGLPIHKQVPRFYWASTQQRATTKIRNQVDRYR